MTQILVQNADEIRTDRCLKFGLPPLRLDHDAGLAIPLVIKLLANLIPVQALQKDVEAAVEQSLDADQPSDAPNFVDRRIGIILVFPALLQKGHSDTLPPRGGVGHHLAVPRLENVQRYIDLREKHDVGKREHRDALRDAEDRVFASSVFILRSAVRLGLHISR